MKRCLCILLALMICTSLAPLHAETTPEDDSFGLDCTVWVPGADRTLVPASVLCFVTDSPDGFQPNTAVGQRASADECAQRSSAPLFYVSPSGALTVVLFEFTGECAAQLPTPESHFFVDVV